jgi:hypothetical protein
MISNYRLSIKLLITTLCVASFVACQNSDDGDDGGNGGGGSNTTNVSFTRTASTNGSGIAEFDFQVAEGVTKFSIVAEVGSNFVSFTQIEDDSGNNYLNPGSVQLSEANTPISLINSATIPSRPVDSAANSTRVYTARVYVSDGSGFSPVSGAPVRMTVLGSKDGSFSNGTLNVSIFYVGNVGQSAESKAAVGVATSEFTRIYRDEANITVNVRELDISGGETIPDPVDGSSIYQTASSQVSQPSVSILIAGDVSGFEGEIYGIAGGIPGPPVSSIHSGVAVSILTSAGPNGTFSETELRVLGETLAHEVGHYMGLFHPADFNGNFVSAEDPLSDTPSCTSRPSCQSVNSLASNLMFATPVVDGDGGLVPQNQLSPQQSGVMNRYIAVN